MTSRKESPRKEQDGSVALSVEDDSIHAIAHISAEV
jgi:hypothetical protein